MRVNIESLSANDSVTSVPPPAASSSYRQVFTTVSFTPTENANSLPGSDAVTVHVVQ